MSHSYFHTIRYFKTMNHTWYTLYATPLPKTARGVFLFMIPFRYTIWLYLWILFLYSHMPFWKNIWTCVHIFIYHIAYYLMRLPIWKPNHNPHKNTFNATLPPALHPKAPPIFAPSHSFIENCLHCYDFFVILYLSINKNL